MDTLARFLGEYTAPERFHSWLQWGYQAYSTAAHSDWGFPIASSIALVAVLYLVLRTSQTAHACVHVYWHSSRVGKMVRSIKGRYAVKKAQREKEHRWIAEHLVDMLDEGRLNGHISANTAHKIQDWIGSKFGINDLKSKLSPKRRQLVLKSKLKKKHGSKIIMLVKERQVRDKNTLIDRINRAAKAA